MNIHVFAEGDRPIRRARDVARGGDAILIHAGVYPEALDSYDGPIQGGTSWSSKLTIKPYRRDRVVLKPTSGEFVIRCAHHAASYIEFRGLVLDASQVAHSAVKVTYSGTDPANTAHHVRFVECELTGARESGAFWTAPHVEFVRCTIYDNGTTTNLDHGLYCAGPDAVVRDCDVYENAACGICLYNGAAPVVDRVRVFGNRCWDNGAAGRVGAGILVASGKDARVEGNVCWDNDIGIRVYKTSRGATLARNSLGPTRPAAPGIDSSRISIAPEAYASTAFGAGIDANVEW